MGQDKARVLLDYLPLLAHLSAQIEKCCPVHVVADSSDRYEDLGFECLVDRPPGAGPLAGLCAAMHHRVEIYGYGWLLLVNCDLVKWSSRWLAELSENISDQVDAVAFARTASSSDSIASLAIAEHANPPDPLPALYHTRLLPQIDQALSRDRRSLVRLLASNRTAVLRESPATPWSFNTPEELAKRIAMLGK